MSYVIRNHTKENLQKEQSKTIKYNTNVECKYNTNNYRVPIYEYNIDQDNTISAKQPSG